MISASSNECNVGIEDPSRDPLASPYLILELIESDQGGIEGREKREEYINRNPHCIEWTNDAILLTIKNLGKVASDLVKVEYEIVFCTLKEHGAANAFNTEHAGELQGSTKDDRAFLSYVPPLGSTTIQIPLRMPIDTICNLYFRARVSTLWSGLKPMKDWDFSQDPTITEGWKRLR